MNLVNHRRLRMIALLCAALFSASILAAQQPSVDTQDSTTVAEFAVPYSDYASPQARSMFQRVLEDGRRAPPLAGPVAASRAYYDHINRDRASRMQRLYPVKIQTRMIGGVPAQVVTPAQGIAATQKRRVLINLHGGAFLWGAGSGGLRS